MDDSGWANLPPPQRDSGSELLVQPWSGVIYNIQCTSKKGLRSGPSGMDVLGFFSAYNPESVQVLRGPGGLLGIAVVQFRDDLEGLKDAFAFERYFAAHKHSRDDWMANQGEGKEVGNSLYGWLARREDYESPELSRYLQATAKLVELGCITQEMEDAQEKAVKDLAEKTKEVEHWSRKVRETARGSLTEFSCLREDMIKELDSAQSEISLLRTGYENERATSEHLRQTLGRRLAEARVRLEEKSTELDTAKSNSATYEKAARVIQRQLGEANMQLDRWMKNATALALMGKESGFDKERALDSSEYYHKRCLELEALLKIERRKVEQRKECIVCMNDFGPAVDQQRSHYKDCHHANVCVGCSNKLWDTKKRKCPSCNTLATEKPGHLPAKIFL